MGLIQLPEDGYAPEWSTDDMEAGTQTVQQHLMDNSYKGAHAQSPKLVKTLSISECFRLHDQLHAASGDTAIFNFLTEIGIEV
jgi:hypothetical protein